MANGLFLRSIGEFKIIHGGWRSQKKKNTNDHSILRLHRENSKDTDNI